jgi:hypothetical protein
MFEDVGSAVETADPGALIVAEGPVNFQPALFSGAASSGGIMDLSVAASSPVVLTVNGTHPAEVVYSIHDYPKTIGGSAIDSGAAMNTARMNAWGYLVGTNFAPMWIGEMGASLDGTADSAGTVSTGGTALADEQTWATDLVAFLNGKAPGALTFTANQQPVSTDWWTLGNLTGQYPDGTDTGGTTNTAQAAVYDQLQPAALAAPACAPAASLTAINTAGPPIMDAACNSWALTAGGQVSVNGVVDATTSNVLELAYVGGFIWQENAATTWYYKTAPGSTWLPTLGTTTPPSTTLILQVPLSFQ